jgi:hypothetical protein
MSERSARIMPRRVSDRTCAASARETLVGASANASSSIGVDFSFALTTFSTGELRRAHNRSRSTSNVGAPIA